MSAEGGGVNCCQLQSLWVEGETVANRASGWRGKLLPAEPLGGGVNCCQQSLCVVEGETVANRASGWRGKVLPGSGEVDKCCQQCRGRVKCGQPCRGRVKCCQQCGGGR